LVMSNGGFGGIHQKLLDKLAQKAAGVNNSFLFDGAKGQAAGFAAAL
ncbi:hypothetical protein, partial [Klebsiella pneumoniae]